MAGTLRRYDGGAFTIWFTGLSGAGKSTLAKALAAHMADVSLPHKLLDGDEIRHGLCRDLGFSKRDRDENVRRIASASKLLNERGVIAVVAAIAPYRGARLQAREICGRFVEVFVDCPLPTLIQRDTKGVYQRALAGELQQFTGVSDPYERPEAPDIYIDSNSETEEESVGRLLAALSDLQYLPAASQAWLQNKLSA